MAALGTYLSRLREERGLSIEEVSRVTRVAPHYLVALEREDFGALPASVFTKGYIRAYCQALGVSVDEALARYSDKPESVTASPPLAPPPPAAATNAAHPKESRRRSRGTLLVSFALLVGFGLALFVMALFLQSGRPEIGPRRVDPPAPPATPAPSVAAEPEPSAAPPPDLASPEPAAAVAPAPTVTSPPAPAAPPAAPAASPVPPRPATVPRPPESKPAVPPETRTATETARPGAAPGIAEAPPLRLGNVISPYRLVARTTEQTWLRVRTEDGRATEETIPAGEVREWISNRPFVVTIGNAAGVALELNGQKLPPLGGRGAVIGQLTLPPTQP
jgi:cytoskeleton protein RodZ